MRNSHTRTGWISLAVSWVKVMRLLSALLIWIVLATSAASQSWQAKLTRDAAYIAGSVSYPGLGIGFACHSRAPERGSVINSDWFEASIGKPGQFLIDFSTALVPSGMSRRSDLILVVDQTGYRLPSVGWNDMLSSWETSVGVTDALFGALPTASRLILQVGTQQAWELPVNGLGAAVDQARAHCMAAWNGVVFALPAAPAPAPAAGQPFQLPPQIQAYANGQCNGPARIGVDALQAGDLDRDGIPDVVVDWRDVLCPGESYSGFCGAANCSIDIFVSSRGYARPFQMLGTSAGIGPGRGGGLVVQVNGTYGLCGHTGCDAPWVWTGSTFEQQK